MSKIDLLVDTNAQLSGDNDLIISVHVRPSVDMDDVNIVIEQNGQGFVSETISLKAGDWTAVTFSEGDESITLTGVHQHECEGWCYINQNLSEVFEPGSVTATVRAWDHNAEQSNIIEEKQFGLFKDLEDRGLEWFWADPNLEPFNMIGNIRPKFYDHEGQMDDWLTSTPIGNGTGFLISPKHVMTNAHVVAVREYWDIDDGNTESPQDLSETVGMAFHLGRSGDEVDQIYFGNEVFIFDRSWADGGIETSSIFKDLAIIELNEEVSLEHEDQPFVNQSFFELLVNSPYDDGAPHLGGNDLPFWLSGYGSDDIDQGGQNFQWLTAGAIDDIKEHPDDKIASVISDDNTAAGHSGSPLMIETDDGWAVYAVLSSYIPKFWSGPKNYGPVITPAVAEWVEHVVEGSADQWIDGVTKKFNYIDPRVLYEPEFVVEGDELKIRYELLDDLSLMLDPNESFTFAFWKEGDTIAHARRNPTELNLNKGYQEFSISRFASDDHSSNVSKIFDGEWDELLVTFWDQPAVKENGVVSRGSQVKVEDLNIAGLFDPSPDSTANAFELYDSTQQLPKDLLEAMLGNVNGISIVENSISYMGADAATSTFESLDFGGNVRMHHPGVLLTSGDGAPPLENTSNSYTKAHYTPGDSQFDLLAQEAFGGAGTTNDAAILEFQFTVDDPTIQSVSLDLIFGSEEYPNFIDSSYVDIAAVLVNDVNYGLFEGDPEQPLSVVGNSVESGSFYDNMNDQYAIEYNGISPRLTINIPL
ncbi:choice-of-anchor L domain-containing protein, partial [Ectothiorhodospira haloalkaliphila]|uniref:choice-of-anchor L domain-containing protein n=1 Tax=Ectothiorhodospira haloalkaliphila TaxID=421628 RepID=UPI001EE991F6